MKKITTLILSCIALTGLAQPTITSSMAPQPGQSETLFDVDVTTVSPGPSGAMQTWNFGNAATLGTSNTTNYISPSSTPYASLFPNANLAIDGSDGTDTTYAFLQNTNLLTQYLGVYYNLQGQTISFSFNDPQTVLVYPFTYTTTYTDLYSVSFSLSPGGGITITNYINGSISTVGDAYGTLITPAGTFSNALRVKRNTISHDSTVYVGVPLPPEESTTNGTSYVWLSGSGLTPLFTISHDTIDAGSGTIQYNSSASYGTLTSGIKENGLMSLNAYPNPTSDNATISYIPNKSGGAYIEVMDLNGRRVGYWNIETQANQTQNLRIQLMNEPAGIYHVRIMQGSDIFTSRIIKN